MAPLAKIRTWYARYERPISSLSLIGGFLFNALTLTRVDQFWENFWVALHLVIVAVCIILINRGEGRGERFHFWLTTILQFTFGGLFSTFIVFYFRSAVLAVAWPFFLILVLGFLANQAFKKQYSRISFQISFFFLSLYLFFIFLIPVLLHEISRTVFLVSGGASLIVLLTFLSILKGRKTVLPIIFGIYVLVNGLYFLNLIPPLPLSLTDAGIFSSISKTPDGNYAGEREASRAVASGKAYAYSAIFSPISFSTNIIHEWQEYNAESKKWVTAARIPLTVSGGREDGFRTYSIYTNLTTGKWRVNVKTADGLVIGRMSFTVENAIMQI